MLTETSSKADELAHWEAFLATLPKGSYLAMYLDGSVDLLRQRMANDMACELLAELSARRTQRELDTQEAIAASDKARAELKLLQGQVRAAHRELDILEDDFKDVASAAATLHNRASQDHCKVKDVASKANQRKWGAA